MQALTWAPLHSEYIPQFEQVVEATAGQEIVDLDGSLRLVGAWIQRGKVGKEGEGNGTRQNQDFVTGASKRVSLA